MKRKTKRKLMAQAETEKRDKAETLKAWSTRNGLISKRKKKVKTSFWLRLRSIIGI